jgi:hypothetical protein
MTDACECERKLQFNKKKVKKKERKNEKGEREEIDQNNHLGSDRSESRGCVGTSKEHEGVLIV